MSLALILGSTVVGGCAAPPPAHWAQGGARVEVPAARWVRSETMTVDVLPNGKVTVNGEHELTIDRAGRVFDPNGVAIALLEPDGKLVGPGDSSLGEVGASSASLPNEKTAWLTLLPTGEVVRYDDLGGKASMGAWIGQCQMTPRTRQVCLLVTHLVATRQRNPNQGGITFGLGVGVGLR